MSPSPRWHSPAIVVAFALLLWGLSTAGRLALQLPGAVQPHVSSPYHIDAVIVATGAVTSAGIDPISIDRTYSAVGGAMVLVLMQLGVWLWLIAGGLLIMRNRTWRQCVTLVQVIVVSSLLLEGIAALLLWPATGSFRESLFLAVSAFSGTGYTIGPLPHPAVQLALLGPLIVLGQVMVLALDGRATFLHSLSYLAIAGFAMAGAAMLIEAVPFADAAFAGVGFGTGFVDTPLGTARVADGPSPNMMIVLVMFTNGCAWFMAGRRFRWAVAMMLAVVAVRYGLMVAIAPDGLTLAASAIAASGMGDALAGAIGYDTRDALPALMLIGRVIPLAVLALASVVLPPAPASLPADADA